MSRRSAQKFTASAPALPPVQQAGDALSKFHTGVVSWMNAMALAYNRSVEATQRDRATTATVIPFYDSKGLPDTIYYCINASLGEDGALHEVNKQKAAWALRFSLTTDLFEILYCAPLTDPIVWTVYFSITSAGVYSGTDNRTYLVVGNEDATLPNNRQVQGTANRITLTDGGAGSTMTFDISAAYVGQTSITTLGTIATGTWGTTAKILRPSVTKTANYTVTVADEYIFADASGGAFTLTLPTAASASGQEFTIKKIDATGYAVTVDANGSETIDGALTQVITAPYVSMTIFSNGSAWYIV